MSGGRPRRDEPAVAAGLAYPHALRTPGAEPAASLLGVAVAVLGFVLLTPLVTQALAGLYWLAVGRPGEFAETRRALLAYELPFGLAVSHLGLAVLIPFAMLLVRLLHGVSPGYLSSVAGRLRWRWLLACLGVGFVTLWAVLAVQNLTADTTTQWQWRPQQGAVWFLAVMVLTTPLQAAAEEYFFRGYLTQALGSLVASPWFGIVTSAAVFTAFHASSNAALMADRFAFGVLAGWLVLRTGGLEAAIGAHVAHNVTSFALATLTSSVAQLRAVTEVTWAAAGWDIARFVVYALAIAWLARGWRPQVTTSV